jgi:hypothetical protein
MAICIADVEIVLTLDQKIAAPPAPSAPTWARLFITTHSISLTQPGQANTAASTHNREEPNPTPRASAACARYTRRKVGKILEIQQARRVCAVKRPGAQPVKHCFFAQACGFGQPVHGQLDGPLPVGYVASRNRQKPPVAGGVGAPRSPGHGLVHGSTLRPEYKRGKVRLSLLLRCRKEDQPMSTIATPDRFTTLPDEPMIASAVAAGEEHGLSVETKNLTPILEAAHERIYQHNLVLEDARAIAAHGKHSSVGEILEIRQELPGRIHIVLVCQGVGFW